MEDKKKTPHSCIFDRIFEYFYLSDIYANNRCL